MVSGIRSLECKECGVPYLVLFINIAIVLCAQASRPTYIHGTARFQHLWARCSLPVAGRPRRASLDDGSFGDGTCSRWVSSQSWLGSALPSSRWSASSLLQPILRHTRVCTHVHALSLPPSLCTSSSALRASTQGRSLPLVNFEAPKMFLTLCQVLLGTLNSQGACGGHEQW